MLQFEVEHIKGSKNIVADGLSWMFEESALPSIPSTKSIDKNYSLLLSAFLVAFKELASNQKDDPELFAIMNKIKVGKEIFPYSLTDKNVAIV